MIDAAQIIENFQIIVVRIEPKFLVSYRPNWCIELFQFDLPDSPPVISSLVLGNGSVCVDMLHSSDLSSSMESLAYDSSSTTSPSNCHPTSATALLSAAGGLTSVQQRTKRMRTSFKHHQLRTMKTYFNVNQNPDAKDLKQLAQKTGLSKRVLQVIENATLRLYLLDFLEIFNRVDVSIVSLQVWFQNARAKWRRNIMRQESSQANVNGINMLPLRPTANDFQIDKMNNRLINESNLMEVEDYGRSRQQTNANQTMQFEELY